MARPKKNHDPRHDQKNDPDQAQAQAQGQLQGQLQGQAQGQAQLAVQSLDSKSDNKNDNDDKNDNKNSNSNDIDNKVDNKLDNKTSNETDNKVDNKLSNDVENKVENTIDNKVNVEVDVKVDLDLKADGLSSPVIDLHGLSCISDSLIMPDVVYQTMGNGNQFNIDQVNYLVDNDKVYHPEVSFDGKGGDLKMEAHAEGGDSKIEGDVGNVIGAAASGITSSADAVLTQDAFNQTITQGANIQFNSMTIQAAGTTLDDDHSLGS